MPRRPALLAVALLVGCNGGGGPPAPAAAPPAEPRENTGPATPSPVPPAASPTPPGPPTACERTPFAASVDLAEASAALYVAAEADRPAHVLVVADSGNRGAFVVLDPTTGAELARGALPLDPTASDDVEGLARAGDRYVALLSSGHVLGYRRVGLVAFELEAPAYPIGVGGDVCPDARRSNCARNWEDVCLFDPPPATGCAGYAASKRDGQLVCLAWQGDRLRLDPARAIDVAPREALAACVARADGSMLAGMNMFGTNRVVHIAPGAALTDLGRLGSGFPEAIAAGPDGVVYRFSDLSNRPSLMDRFVCRSRE